MQYCVNENTLHYNMKQLPLHFIDKSTINLCRRITSFTINATQLFTVNGKMLTSNIKLFDKTCFQRFSPQVHPAIKIN